MLWPRNDARRDRNGHRSGDAATARDQQRRSGLATRRVHDRNPAADRAGRRELWFETPCQAEIRDPDFIASLQRALAARDLYRGPANGVMDARTRRAIRAFQEPQGLNSPILSMAAARQLGLVVWDPVAAAGGATGG
ncbi:peptidoglycan-binding domain-containing protein [Fontisubflavum oceani]|uniref:peptidoglycan-binding domain-containing protein n=1 Tax=Fontisubflavum oceani TaxID=2978973 RepID=UPI002ED5FEDB